MKNEIRRFAKTDEIKTFDMNFVYFKPGVGNLIAKLKLIRATFQKKKKLGAGYTKFLGATQF